MFKKQHILLVMITIVMLVIFRYRFLPAKKVNLNESFTIHNGQTVTFGKDKYMKYCGTRGNAWAGTGPYAEYSMQVNGITYPCGTLKYNVGIQRPFFVRFFDHKNPATAIIKDIDNYYSEVLDNFNKTYESCDKNDKCDKEYAVASLQYLKDPKLCKMQKLIDEQKCLDNYISAFKKICTPHPEIRTENGFIEAIENQDNCLLNHIANSEGCVLLITDPIKKESCLQDSRKKEAYLETLRN